MNSLIELADNLDNKQQRRAFVAQRVHLHNTVHNPKKIEFQVIVGTHSCFPTSCCFYCGRGNYLALHSGRCQFWRTLHIGAPFGVRFNPNPVRLSGDCF